MTHPQVMRRLTLAKPHYGMTATTATATTTSITISTTTPPANPQPLLNTTTNPVATSQYSHHNASPQTHPPSSHPQANRHTLTGALPLTIRYVAYLC